MYIVVRRLKTISQALFFLLLFFSQNILAMPDALNFQARILNPSGLPLELAAVDFKFKYTDASGACVLYQEDFVGVNMTGSNGLVTLAMGSGTKAFPVTATTLYDIFNYGASLSCLSVGATGVTGGPVAPVTPTVLDKRQIVVEFNDGSGWQGLPSMSLNSVPYALHSRLAYNATRLGGVAAASYIKFTDITAAACTAGQALRYDGTNFVCETVGGGGTVTTVTASAPLVSTGGTAPNITLAKATAAVSGYLASSDFTIFNSKLSNFSTMTSSDVTGALGYTPLNSAGSVTSVAGRTGVVTLSSSDISGVTFGTTVNTFAQGNDSRFTDSRTPSGVASGDLTGTYPSPTLVTTGVVASSDYTKVTVDAKGRVTTASRLTSSDISILYGYTPSNSSSAWTEYVSGDVSRATGNVGIGTASPTAKLEVVGDAKIYGLTVGRGGGANSSNVAVGASALNANVSGNFNTAVGSNALQSTTNATQNTAIGSAAMVSLTSGSYNTALGQGALASATSATYTVAVGIASMGGVAFPGSLNVGLGYATLYSASGGNNAGIGSQALRSLTSGVNNTAVGSRAGYGDNTANQQSTVDSYATFVGYAASRSDTIAQATPLTNITAIGKNAKVATSNSIVLGGTGADSVNVGIGTISPQMPLHIQTSTVNTGMIVRNTNTTNGASVPIFIASNSDGTLTNVSLENLGPNGASPGGLLFRTGATTESGYGTPRMTLLNTGEVGIGTPSPTQLLEVAGTIYSTSGGFKFPDGTTQITASTGTLALTTGNIFVGVAGVATSVVPSGDVSSATGGEFVLRNSAGTRSNLGLGTASVFNVPVAGDAGTGEVVKGDDSRLIDSRAPTGAASGDLTGTYPNPTLATTGVVASADYTKVTVDAKGRVTSAGRLASTDITALYGYTPSSGSALPSDSVPIYQVKVATNQNISLSGPQTIDGVSVVAGNRVLAKNQSVDVQNGVYVVSAGAWTRATEIDSWSEVQDYVVRISEGTVQKGMIYTSAVASSGTIDSSSINWVSVGSGSTGHQNTALGINVLNAITAGNTSNAAFGYNAMASTTSGGFNTSVGASSLYLNTTGATNVAIGRGALYSNEIGNSNVAIGSNALVNVTTGSNNTGLGSNAGSAVTTGSNNVIIGTLPGTAALANTILIGDGAGNERLRINSAGNVGIGTTSPGYQLHVNYNDSSSDNGVKIENAGTVGPELALKTTSAGGREYLMISTGSSNSIGAGYWGLYDNTAGGGAAGYRMVANSSGNIGIGVNSPAAKLDVAGEVKFGNTSSTCNGTTEGQQRYNSASKEMEFCNGTAWSDFAPKGSWCGNDNSTGDYNRLCKSLIPFVSCPSGYSLLNLGIAPVSSEGSGEIMYTCMKN